MANERDRFTVFAGCKELDLAEGALLIAAEAYEDLDLPFYLGELDRLAERSQPVVGTAGSVLERTARLSDHLYGALGFHGNQDEYYDPRNSFLNEVIERKTGIPISLAIVFMEVAHRLDLPLDGVNFPGHFLVRVADGSDPVVIDPFTGGILSEDDCRDKLHEAAGEDAELDARHLKPASTREILLRMLSNLKYVYFQAEDYTEALACSERALILNPDAPFELRDRGLIYRELECFGPALRDLEHFLAANPDPSVGAQLGEVVESLREQVRLIH